MKKFLAICVDDEADLLDFVSEIVEGLDAKVIRASNGLEAWEALQDCLSKNIKVDAIFSDINMKKMDGLTLLAKVRELGLYTPFVVMSAYGDMAKVTTALRLGALDFLEKPFDFTHFESVAINAMNIGQSINNSLVNFAQELKDKSISSEKTNDFTKAQVELLKMRHSIDKKKVG